MPARLRDSRTLKLLRQDHEHIGKALHLASADTEATADAAKHLDGLCREHFEFEERAVFPALARLQALLAREAGDAAPGDIRTEIAELKRHEELVERAHQVIVSAGEALKDAASREGNQQLAELAQILTNHERLEEDLRFAIYELSMLKGPPAVPRS